MTQNERNNEMLETAIAKIDWSNVSLEPNPQEIAAIDRIVPGEWGELLEGMSDAIAENEFDQEILQPLLSMTNAELDRQVRETIIALSIDTNEIIQEVERNEREQKKDQEYTHHQDIDFER